MIETIWSSDAEDTEEFFRYAGYKARDMREPLERIGDDLFDWITVTFNEEGKNVGEPWVEVSEAWRKVKDHGPLITSALLLRYTDNLIDAAIGSEASDDPAHLTITRTELTYILDHQYAHIHQEGATWATSKGNLAKIPARPFLVVENTDFERVIRDHFEDWLDDVKHANIRRRGLQQLNPLSDAARIQGSL